MADVALKAGVSTATVSRALRGVPGVSAHTRARVRQIADDLSYVISPEASQLARGRTGRVAVVVPRFDVWFYAAMLASIENVLSTAELDVLVYQVDGIEQRTRFFGELPARRKVDAVVLVAMPLSAAEEERLDLLEMQVVVAGGRLRNYPHVRTDDHGAAVTAVDHLLSLGHRRIAMVRSSDTSGAAWSADLERTRGYHDALSAAGVEILGDYLVTEPYGVGAGVGAVDRLLALPEPPTAVFAYSDEIAIAARHRFTERGRRVPEDISLAGIDGHPLAALFGLTTVTQAVSTQGRLTGEMVLALVRGEALTDPTTCVPYELVVRTSTAPPPT